MEQRGRLRRRVAVHGERGAGERGREAEAGERRVPDQLSPFEAVHVPLPHDEDALVVEDLGDRAVRSELRVAAVDLVVEAAGGAELQRAVRLRAGHRDHHVAEADVVDAERQQHRRAQRVDVGDLVVEPVRGLEPADADAELVVEAVVGERPVEIHFVLAEVAERAGEELDADPQLRRRAAGEVDPHLGEVEAPLAGAGEIVVLVRLQEPLAEKAVDLDLAEIGGVGGAGGHQERRGDEDGAPRAARESGHSGHVVPPDRRSRTCGPLPVRAAPDLGRRNSSWAKRRFLTLFTGKIYLLRLLLRRRPQLRPAAPRRRPSGRDAPDPETRAQAGDAATAR